MPKLDYLTLLSSEPVLLQNVGHIKPPKLIDIRRLGMTNYNMFISVLNFTQNKFEEVFNVKNNKKEYFDLIFNDQNFREMFYNIFSFFICENIYVDVNDKCYVVYRNNPNPKDDKDKYLIVGLINKDTFDDVKDVILQFNYVKSNVIDKSKVKDQHTRDLLDFMEKAREKQKTSTKDDENLTLPNIISALSTFHNTLNILNIWDLTVYQLFDQFKRQSYKNQIDMCSMNHSVWGGEFDNSIWFDSMNH